MVVMAMRLHQYVVIKTDEGITIVVTRLFMVIQCGIRAAVTVIRAGDTKPRTVEAASGLGGGRHRDRGAPGRRAAIAGFRDMASLVSRGQKRGSTQEICERSGLGGEKTSARFCWRCLSGGIPLERTV